MAHDRRRQPPPVPDWDKIEPQAKGMSLPLRIGIYVGSGILMATLAICIGYYAAQNIKGNPDSNPRDSRSLNPLANIGCPIVALRFNNYLESQAFEVSDEWTISCEAEGGVSHLFIIDDKTGKEFAILNIGSETYRKRMIAGGRFRVNAITTGASRLAVFQGDSILLRDVPKNCWQIKAN